MGSRVHPEDLKVCSRSRTENRPGRVCSEWMQPGSHDEDDDSGIRFGSMTVLLLYRYSAGVALYNAVRLGPYHYTCVKTHQTQSRECSDPPGNPDDGDL